VPLQFDVHVMLALVPSIQNPVLLVETEKKTFSLARLMAHGPKPLQYDEFSWATMQCLSPTKSVPLKKNPPKVHENLRNKQSLNIMMCCVSETKGQDQPEDEDAAKARPELEQGESRLLRLRQRNRSSN